MQNFIADVVEPVYPAALLDLGRKKVDRWQEVVGMPDDWGHESSNCGQRCVSKLENGVLTVVPLRCKQWSCSGCGYMRYGWFVRNVEEAIRVHGLRRMWSFTLRTYGRAAYQSFFFILIYWGKLHDRLTRLCGHFEYILMVETTE